MKWVTTEGDSDDIQETARIGVFNLRVWFESGAFQWIIVSGGYAVANGSNYYIWEAMRAAETNMLRIIQDMLTQLFDR